MYLKTSEPLILPSYKYPVSKHYCSRIASPRSTELGDHPQKSNVHFRYPSVYSGSRTFSFSSLPEVQKEEHESISLELNCKSLLNAKLLPETSQLKKTNITHSNKRFNDLLLPAFLPENHQKTIPFRLRYCSMKNFPLPQVNASRPLLKERRN